MKRNKLKINYLLLNLLIFFLFISCKHQQDIVTYIPDKTKTDWLLLMYMDGDDASICDYIQNEISLMQKGLIQQALKENQQSIKIVILSDNYYKKNNDGFSYVLELEKIDDSKDDDFEYAKNISSFADINWLTFDSQLNKGEVNMGDSKTLTSFLRWANETYSADKILLTIADHGGGPYSHNINDFSTESRLVCLDSNPKSSGIDSVDFAKAICNSGIKLDIILFDVCNGASIEDFYECRNCANYLIGCPNELEIFGFPFDDFISSSFSKNNSTEDIIKNLVNCFAKHYSDVNEIDSFKIWYDNGWEYEQSITAIKTENLEQIFSKIDDFSTFLLTNSSYRNCLIDNKHSFLKVWPNSYNNNAHSNFVPSEEFPQIGTLAYNASFGQNVHDLGYLVQQYYELAVAEQKSDIIELTKSILDLLKDIVVYSWRQNPASIEATTEVYTSGNYMNFHKGLYPLLNNNNLNGENNYYGITICGSTDGYYNYKQENNNVIYVYENSTTFGHFSKWNQVLKSVFPEKLVTK